MSFMAELGEDGQLKTEKVLPTAVETEGISGGVKIEKKGRQTVIQVTNVMTGLPPVSTTPTATPSYPGMMPWTGVATLPGATVSPAATAANPWGYYYPPAQYGVAPNDGTTPTDPNAASNPYGYPTDYTQQPGQQQYDYSQYQQYYSQWYATQAGAQQPPQQPNSQASPPPPPPMTTEDTDMG